MKSHVLDSRQIKYTKVQKSKKDKVVASVLALFLGAFGIHRFYLGQTGMGILYCILGFALWPLMAVISVIDAIVLLAMDSDKFNLKYNRDLFQWQEPTQQPPTTPQNRKTVEPIQPVDRYQREKQVRKEQQLKQRDRRAALNKHKANGVAHFREYDFKSAIVDFEKALAINPKDTATHFNMACAYSLLEDATQSLHHLDKAVANGFNDFLRIKTHDALAYVRIQDEYEAFEANKFRLPVKSRMIAVEEVTQDAPNIEAPKEDLLEQLKKLGELRERGYLTDEEFIEQKQKLFR